MSPNVRSVPPNGHSVSPNGHSVSRNKDLSYSRILKVKELFKSKRLKSSDIVGGYGIPAIPTQSAVHSYCLCDCHHSIGLYTHVCVGMAGMPYPPTDTHSSVFQKPVLLSFQTTTCSHVLLSFPNNMFSCSSVFSNNNMFSCSLVFPQQHVLMFFCLFKQQHVLMSSCLQNNNMFSCSLVFQKQHVLLSFPKKNHVLPSNYVFMSPKKTAESNAPSR